MQKGILDGGFVTYSTLKTMRFAEVAKYMTLCTSTVLTPDQGYDLTTWNKLPPDMQKIFQNNVGWFGLEADKDVDQTNRKGSSSGKKNVWNSSIFQGRHSEVLRLVQEEAVKVAKKHRRQGTSRHGHF